MGFHAAGNALKPTQGVGFKAAGCARLCENTETGTSLIDESFRFSRAYLRKALPTIAVGTRSISCVNIP